MLHMEVEGFANMKVLNLPINSATVMPLYMEPRAQRIYICGCFNKGSILLGGVCSANAIIAGQTARLNYVISNQSSVSIKCIRVSLMEEITYSAKGFDRSDKSILFEETIKNDMSSQSSQI